MVRTSKDYIFYDKSLLPNAWQTICIFSVKQKHIVKYRYPSICDLIQENSRFRFRTEIICFLIELAWSCFGLQFIITPFRNEFFYIFNGKVWSQSWFNREYKIVPLNLFSKCKCSFFFFHFVMKRPAIIGIFNTYWLNYKLMLSLIYHKSVYPCYVFFFCFLFIYF